jgi:hypothetical protein
LLRKEATPTPVPTAVPTVAPTAKPDLTVEEEVVTDSEPVTVPGAGVDLCLWKPVSDTNPKVAVLSIAAAYSNRGDLEVAVFSGGKELLRARTYSIHRGNKLPQHKYGRFNIKLGRVGAKFPKGIVVRFYSLGKRVTVGGLKEMKIADPTKRYVAENGKIRLDPK